MNLFREDNLNGNFFNHIPSSSIYMSNLVYFDLLRLLQEIFHNIITKENQSKQCAGAAVRGRISGHVETKEKEPSKIKGRPDESFSRVDREFPRSIKSSVLEKNHTNALTSHVAIICDAWPSNHSNAIWSPLLV